jgi:glycosyltransferase involved in cell wall biosynthesis
MKIIIDFRKYDGVVGGVEQGAIQIIKHVTEHGHEAIVVCKENRLSNVKGLFGEIDRLTIKPLPIKNHAMSIANARIDSGFFQDIAINEGADIIHFFYNWSFPFKKKVPSILTIHDVIPFTFREAMGFFRNHFFYRPSLRIACRLNNIITTVSEYSKQDISKKVGAPLSKIHVIPNGLRDPAEPDEKIQGELEKKLRLKNGFILNVGGIHERKNIIRLVLSFAKLVQIEGYTGNLIITGSVSGAPYQEKMKKMCDATIAEVGMENRIIFTGFVSEKELDILLRIADVFVYPSLYEGFGIPILEAMKLGTPVITSNVTAMPEVAGNAAILVDPYSVEDMVSAISRLLQDKVLRNELITKGKERSVGYSWDSTCRQYLKLYEEIAHEIS